MLGCWLQQLSPEDFILKWWVQGFPLNLTATNTRHTSTSSAAGAVWEPQRKIIHQNACSETETCPQSFWIETDQIFLSKYILFSYRIYFFIIFCPWKYMKYSYRIYLYNFLDMNSLSNYTLFNSLFNQHRLIGNMWFSLHFCETAKIYTKLKLKLANKMCSFPH